MGQYHKISMASNTNCFTPCILNNFTKLTFKSLVLMFIDFISLALVII